MSNSETSGESRYGRYADLSDAEKIALGRKVVQRFAGKAERIYQLNIQLFVWAIFFFCISGVLFGLFNASLPQWLTDFILLLPLLLLLVITKLRKNLNRFLGVSHDGEEEGENFPRSEEEAERVLSAIAVPELFPELVQAHFVLKIYSAITRAASQITADNAPAEMKESHLAFLARSLMIDHQATLSKVYYPSAEYRIAIMRANRYLRSETINASIKVLMRQRVQKPQARLVRDVAREIGRELNL